MWIQTDRLNIRELKTADGIIFFGMASDGSLTEIWTDTGHPSWMEEWMAEAGRLAALDDPTGDYLAYTVELKENHEVIGSVGCSYMRIWRKSASLILWERNTETMAMPRRQSGPIPDISFSTMNRRKSLPPSGKTIRRRGKPLP